MKNPNPNITVTLPAWEWHHVLNVLEDQTRVINKDNENTCILYENIASQLAGYKVKIEQRAPKTSYPTATQAAPITPQKPWYSRLFS